MHYSKYTKISGDNLSFYLPPFLSDNAPSLILTNSSLQPFPYCTQNGVTTQCFSKDIGPIKLNSVLLWLIISINIKDVPILLIWG